MSEPFTPVLQQSSESAGATPQSQKQQKLAILKLKRITELNNRLKQELQKERIFASNASYSIIDYTQSHKDFAIPEIWGYMAPGENSLRSSANAGSATQLAASHSQDTCCTIV